MKTIFEMFPTQKGIVSYLPQRNKKKDLVESTIFHGYFFAFALGSRWFPSPNAISLRYLNLHVGIQKYRCFLRWVSAGSRWVTQMIFKVKEGRTAAFFTNFMP